MVSRNERKAQKGSPMKKSKKNIVGRTNIASSDATYQLRRKVIELIYEARTLVQNLDRVEVRIVEDEGQILGTASMRVKHISIMTRTVGDSEAMLRHVVFHELVHTLFGIGHIESCPLMKAIVDKPASKTQIHTIFKQYSKGAAA